MKSRLQKTRRVVIGILTLITMTACGATPAQTPEPHVQQQQAPEEAQQQDAPQGKLSGIWQAWGTFTPGNPQHSDEAILTSNIPWDNQRPLTFLIHSADMDAEKPDGFEIKLISQRQGATKYTMIDGSASMLQDGGFWILPPPSETAKGTWSILDDRGQPIEFTYAETNSIWNAGTSGPHRLVALLDPHLMLVTLNLIDGNVSCQGHSILRIDGKDIIDMWGARQPLYYGNTILLYGKTLDSAAAPVVGSGCGKARNSMNIKVINKESLPADVQTRFGI